MKDLITDMELCPRCGKGDQIEAVKINASGVYRGEWIYYTADYDRCERCNKLWEAEDFEKNNQEARRIAYEKKLASKEVKLW